MPGNLELGIFAGLSMGPFARVSARRTGGRRSSYVGNVKYLGR